MDGYTVVQLAIQSFGSVEVGSFRPTDEILSNRVRVIKRELRKIEKANLKEQQKLNAKYNDPETAESLSVDELRLLIRSCVKAELDSLSETFAIPNDTPVGSTSSNEEAPLDESVSEPIAIALGEVLARLTERARIVGWERTVTVAQAFAEVETVAKAVRDLS